MEVFQQIALHQEIVKSTEVPIFVELP